MATAKAAASRQLVLYFPCVIGVFVRFSVLFL
jgi:hypothetical protein